MVDSTTHWRDSARPIKFFMLDGKAVFPLFLVFVWPRLWTAVVALIGLIFFSVMLRFGFTPMVFLRATRCFFAGRRIHSTPWWER